MDSMPLFEMNSLRNIEVNYTYCVLLDLDLTGNCLICIVH